MKFGDLVRALRKEKALSLSGLAAKCSTASRHVSKGYLSGIETGAVPPPAEWVCRRLGKLLGAPGDMLVAASYIEKAPASVRDKIGYSPSLVEAVGALEKIRVEIDPPEADIGANASGNGGANAQILASAPLLPEGFSAFRIPFVQWDEFRKALDEGASLERWLEPNPASSQG